MLHPSLILQCSLLAELSNSHAPHQKCLHTDLSSGFIPLKGGQGTDVPPSPLCSPIPAVYCGRGGPLQRCKSDWVALQLPSSLCFKKQPMSTCKK